MWLPDRDHSVALAPRASPVAGKTGAVAGRTAASGCGCEVRKVVALMNCEEFELRGLDLDRSDADPLEAQAAAKHAEVCANCAALLEAWRAVKGDLRILRESTGLQSAPTRVEMRLKQELRTRREARVPRSSVAIAGWALAAAAVLLASVGWLRTHPGSGAPNTDSERTPNVVAQSAAENPASEATLLAADYDEGEFTQLPGSLSSAVDEASVMQVRLQRGALARFGLPVEPDRALEWVDVDFLVGVDGEPQAVRLHQETDSAATQE